VKIFRAEDDLDMFTTSNFDHEVRFPNLVGEGVVRFEVPFLSLNEGEYYLRVLLYEDWLVGNWDAALIDELPQPARLWVHSGRFAHGCTYVPVQWEYAPRTVEPARDASQSIPATAFPTH
jgi:hypothetical protein